MRSLPKDPRALSRLFLRLALAAVPAVFVATACAGGSGGGPGDDYRCSPVANEYRTRVECPPLPEAEAEATRENYRQQAAAADAGYEGSVDVDSCEIRCRFASRGGMNDCSMIGQTGQCAMQCTVHEYHNCGRRPAGYSGPKRVRSTRRAGSYLAGAAALEAASVDAFEYLAEELSERGAPEELIALAKKSAEDERRHTRTTKRLAKRFGGEYVAPTVRRRRARSLRAMAMENAVEGCVREAYGALVATYQSVHAKDETVRRAMRVIAAEETAHAALALKIAEWAEAQLEEKARREIGAAKRKAARELLRAAEGSVDRELVEVIGLPSGEVALRLVTGLFETQPSPTHCAATETSRA